MTTAFTLYAQQALESCPCPHCGAYTLAFREPIWTAAQKQAARRKAEKRAS